MQTFLFEFTFASAAIVALGMAGGFAVLPFSQNRRFVALLAPMCGLLVLPMPIILLYSGAHVSLVQATIVTFVAMWALTIVSLTRWRPAREDLTLSLLLSVPVVMLAVSMTTISTILNGAPSLLFMHGSDHAGYATVADWLLTHSALEPPTLAPDKPYQSYPNIMLNGDPRLGSFVLLAVVAAARGTHGLFAYDTACAIALAVAVLSVAAVYARSPLVLFGLTAALMTSLWFELGRSGYFGKIIGYPSSLFLFGLLVTSPTISSRSTATLALFTLGAATRHSGLATALILCSIGGVYILLNGLFKYRVERSIHETLERSVALALMVGIAFACNGMFALLKPFGGYLPYDVSWMWILPRLLEIQNAVVDFAIQSAFWISTMAILVVGLQIAIVIVAISLRNAVAAALSGGMLGLMLVLYLTDYRWIGYQILGTVYPAALCGVGYLFDDAARVSRRAALATIAALAVGVVVMRIPRMIGAVKLYTLETTPITRYAAKDFEALATAIGSGVVHIDSAHAAPAISSLVEFGRRGISIQWSPQAWNRVLGYQPWPVPTYAARPDFCLIYNGDPDPPGTLIMETPQFRLIRLPAYQSGKPCK
jgi:hypothetical protein